MTKKRRSSRHVVRTGRQEIARRRDGSRVEAWYQDDLVHRDDGPAVVVWHADGARTETFVRRGELYRDQHGHARFRVSADGAATPVPLRHDEWTVTCWNGYEEYTE